MTAMVKVDGRNKHSPLLLRLDSGCVYNKDFTLCQVYKQRKFNFSTRILCLLNFLYTTTMCSWHTQFKKPKKRGARGFKPRILTKRVNHGFSRKRCSKPHLWFYMKKAGLFISRFKARMLGPWGPLPTLGLLGISRRFWTWCSVQRGIQCRYSSILTSFDRYTFHLVPCGIWRWVIHLSFEEQGTLS
jgi:hypothetical protein